jgi:UDP-N-acetylglucosamine 2-epimerase
MRILVAFGTRPEIIKLGPVCQALQRRKDIDLSVFWTGQHIELAAGLLQLFEIDVTRNGSDVMREPGLASKFGRMTQEIDEELRSRRYEWLVVQGDTATAAAAATAGFLNHVKVAHITGLFACRVQ